MFMAIGKLARVVPATELLPRDGRGGGMWRLARGAVREGGWAPCARARLARWFVGPHAVAWLGGWGRSSPVTRLVRCRGMLGPHEVAWLGGSGCSGARGAPDLLVGSGGAGLSPVGSAVGWGGGEAAVGLSGESPAALMHGAVVGSAQQGEVGQVGGAAMEPVPQMMGFAPGQGPFTVGEDTAAVADGQGGALGGLDDPGGPADFQRLGRGPTQGRGEQGRRGSEPGRQPSVPVPAGMVARVPDQRSLIVIRVLGRRPLIQSLPAAVAGERWCRQRLSAAWVWGRRSLIGAGAVVALVARVLTGDQDPGHGPVTGQPPARLRV
jgi:hypothetical protein